ncbi:amino acid ABC transporter substrate-binding protein [Thalassotalea sp. M1531]|uniref:Amino acid ABC transporter substrate-binding protein n=1 Tax=Thalassotalea algicola TaxID=2716224 RepID=A0A7Y0LF87_9GAMM|nr:transporter substrate-binding domain-containing protein [Thalassotalea algicola]NMP33233.1 amino acid ABC transporter substrate-binding protein [Thalassotalea algicola]
MNRVKRKIIFWLILVLPSSISAQDILHSSVSPEFRGGLQEKFLHYIAERMDLELSIYPITYSQRIKLLKAGKIDLMVGVKDQYAGDQSLLYIKPSYDQLTNSIFVLKKNLNKYEILSDLKNTSIAFTPDNETTKQHIEALGINIMPAEFLKQKIELLRKGRVDGLVHFKQSALSTIKAMGLENEIVLANLPPFSIRKHFVVVSAHSPLKNKSAELSSIIRNGVEKGDFKRIRQTHYQEKTGNTSTAFN